MGDRPEDFRFPRPTREDLPHLARLSYATAAVRCWTCRDYHATWTYLRAAGLNGGGPEYNFPQQVTVLSQLLAGRTHVRWLLAGSADAGVLATAQGVSEAMPGTHHTFTVVDRCETPLVVCRSHAEEHGLALTAVNADLLEFDAAGEFDIVLGHQIIPFFIAGDRERFFRRAASWLAPSGMLCLSIHDRMDVDAPRTRRRQWRLSGLRHDAAAGGLDLPEDLETFVARLRRPESYANRDKHLRLEDHAALLTEIGLVVGTPFPIPGVAPEALDDRTRYLLVATAT